MRVPEVAKQENVSEQTVRNWIKSGVLKASLDQVGYFINSIDLEESKRKYSKTVIDIRSYKKNSAV